MAMPIEVLNGHRTSHQHNINMRKHDETLPSWQLASPARSYSLQLIAALRHLKNHSMTSRLIQITPTRRLDTQTSASGSGAIHQSKGINRGMQTSMALFDWKSSFGWTISTLLSSTASRRLVIPPVVHMKTIYPAEQCSLTCGKAFASERNAASFGLITMEPKKKHRMVQQARRKTQAWWCH